MTTPSQQITVEDYNDKTTYAKLGAALALVAHGWMPVRTEPD